MAEINKTINGYHIYDGSVEEGMTAEEVYKQIKEMEERKL